MGQKYGPFNDIPAVWDQFFVGKGYKALAAGIAGAPRPCLCVFSVLSDQYIWHSYDSGPSDYIVQRCREAWLNACGRTRRVFELLVAELIVCR